jgi:hypothetical protein
MIKATYDPLIKKTKKPGTRLGMNKAETTLFTQRATVKNSRQTPQRRLTIKGQVHMSEDNAIKVNVLEPGSLGDKTGTLKEIRESIGSRNGASVRWAQKNEDGTGGDAENGVVEWVYRFLGGSLVRRESSALSG